MAEKTGKLDIILKLLVLCFFGGLFLHLTVPLFDHDFWWHLAAGKWMWQNKALMSADPFNFPSYPNESELVRDIVFGQYWISQLLMYGVHAAAGFKGLIVLRASVITLVFYTLYRMLMRFGAGRMLSVALVYTSVMVTARELSYIGMRPQIWTSLFSIVLIYLLELQREGRRCTLYAIPALMPLWANMHGGYIFGVMILAIYALVAAISRRKERALYVSIAAAAALSGVNPAGFGAFVIVIRNFIEPDSMKHLGKVAEMESLFKHSSLGGIIRSLPWISGITIASLASFVLNIKGLLRMKKEFILLFALALALGVQAIRFIPFFAVVASMLIALNLRWAVDWLRGLEARKTPLRVMAFALTAALITWAAVDEVQIGRKVTGLTMEKPYADDYRGAVGFVKNYGIHGNAANEHARGGYLIWWLWPEVKVFMDGRVLYPTAFEHYSKAMDTPLMPLPPDGEPAYKKVLRDYDVDLALLSGCDKESGIIIPLSYVLIEDPEWAIVYADASAMVFMRKTSKNRVFVEAHALPKTVGYDNILAMASAAMGSRHGHGVPGIKRSLAIAFMGKGEKRSAQYWINEYLKTRPGDPEALQLKYNILMMEDAPKN